MVDSRFFKVSGPFSLNELEEISGAKVGGDSENRTKMFADVAPLNAAGPGDVTFFEDIRYSPALAVSKAGACLIREEDAAKAPTGMVLLVTPQPLRAFARVANAFYPGGADGVGVHASAVVDASARIGEGCRIDAGAVVGAEAELGDRTLISANAVIGPGVVVGQDGFVGACASLAFCIIGERTYIHPGVRIGQDGFGFIPGRDGHLKVPQLGRVIIGDDVEIGANTTIDRGAASDTVIEDGTKIDNLVQIGHNVRLGKGCIVVAQVGISGSTTVGKGVMIGGQAGFAGHTKVGDGARIAAKTGVIRDIEPGAAVMGYPSVPVRQFFRQVVALAHLAKKKDA
ncbi:MAG: UDP-3-O-(3-hydroxymyristoyl)glucosamine N-acyltransferase [Rhodospirillales bacterium]|nr:UDP-3-O-(3-hydroxymyristoyl)glucosamine N-acyltransferase [Rhodospirillales bacterium]